MVFLAALLSLVATTHPSAAKAASSSEHCLAIRSEAQLQHVNDLVAEGAIQELGHWGQFYLRLKLVARHGTVRKLRITHPTAGKSHIPFDYHCPAEVQIGIAKRMRTCEPNPFKEKIVCGERWVGVGHKERWIRIDRPITVNVPPNRLVSVGLSFAPWYIPGKFALEPGQPPPELTFGG